MKRRDGGLHRVGAGPTRLAQGILHQCEAFRDLGPIPETTVLILQQDDVAFRRRACPAARVMQQHQGQ